MRRAIAEAAVGDEQKREDPTVTELQTRVAALLGQEAALFVPTATMANQIALKLHGPPGRRPARRGALARRRSTSTAARRRTPASDPRAARTSADASRPSRSASAAAPSTKVADQRVAVLSLENTHNNAGGRVWPLDELEEVVAAAREHGLAVHLDGARLLNAATAPSVAPATIAARFDTVTLCLSKGLGCPLGALLAGSRELIERAWREKHLFGGAMRQAGIVAAAGVYALDHHVERLARRPRSGARLARRSSPPASRSISSRSRRTSSSSTSSRSASARTMRSPASREAGVGLSATIHPTVSAR